MVCRQSPMRKHNVASTKSIKIISSKFLFTGFLYRESWRSWAVIGPLVNRGGEGDWEKTSKQVGHLPILSSGVACRSAEMLTVSSQFQIFVKVKIYFQLWNLSFLTLLEKTGVGRRRRRRCEQRNSVTLSTPLGMIFFFFLLGWKIKAKRWHSTLNIERFSNWLLWSALRMKANRSL